jgi:hypothetical protein
MIDVESDGPIPGDYSMVCFGAIIVELALNRTFYGRLRPISEQFVPKALAVSGFSSKANLQDNAQCLPKPFASNLSGHRDDQGLHGKADHQLRSSPRPIPPGLIVIHRKREALQRGRTIKSI